MSRVNRAYFGSKPEAEHLAGWSASEFGGSNLVEGTGRWYGDDGELFLEPSFVVEVITETEHDAIRFNTMATQTLNLGTEQSVLVTTQPITAEFIERSTS